MIFKNKLTFIFQILFCSILFTPEQGKACEEIDKFVDKLPKEQKIALEYFSEKILTSPIGCIGYVVFGDKPMCIATVDESATFTYLSPLNADFLGSKGFDFLCELNIPPEDKKYPFVECIDGYYRDLIFINRDLFIKTVNENISLFRCILSRTLTAESFLDELLKSGDGFYDVFKWNKTILGILLGYGTQNALIISRAEDLTCGLPGNNIYFPFISRKAFIASQQTPSVGFSSLDEESEKLYSFTKLSTHIKNFDYCRIPHFACNPNLQETMDLLSTYEKNRDNIIRVVEEGDIVSKLLKRLCTTVSGTVIPPADLGKQICKISYEDKQIKQKYADCIVMDMIEGRDSRFKKKSIIEAILQGVRWAKEGKNYKDLEWCEEWSYDPRRSFEQHLQMKKANKLLYIISRQSDIVELIPKYIYYKSLVPGKGLPATNKIRKITLNFSLYTDDQTLVECGTIKDTNLDKLIPGIAYSLIGMKIGEEREIYIHPKYAYGSPLDPSAILTTANLKLLDFEEGESEALLPEISEEIIDGERFNKSFLNEYKKIEGYRCFCSGYYFWNEMKKLNIDIDFEEFSKHLRSDSLLKLFNNYSERRKFILNYNCYLFSNEYDRGRRPWLEI